jgi:hypothetical protein
MIKDVIDGKKTYEGSNDYEKIHLLSEDLKQSKMYDLASGAETKKPDKPEIVS